MYVMIPSAEHPPQTAGGRNLTARKRMWPMGVLALNRLLSRLPAERLTSIGRKTR